MDVSISFTSLMDVDDSSQVCPQNTNTPDVETSLPLKPKKHETKPEIHKNIAKYVMDASSSHQQVMKD